jgi:quinol-cytochrome oxidoreductase complex cytochrome b subunit
MPVSRPIGVTISALLMIISIMTLLAMFWIHPPPANGVAPNYLARSTDALQTWSWVWSLIFAIVDLFYWYGNNWARLIVLINSVVRLLALPWAHHHPWELTVRSVLVDGNAVLAIYLLWYLNTPPIRDWFNQRTT